MLTKLMENKIERLAALFRERDKIEEERNRIDAEIEKLIGGGIDKKPSKASKKEPAKQATKEKAPKIVEKKQRAPRAACPGCGSVGARHKIGCKLTGQKRNPDLSNGFPTKEKPHKEIHSYTCHDCHLIFKQNRDKIDAFCPECRSVNVNVYEEPVTVTHAKE